MAAKHLLVLLGFLSMVSANGADSDHFAVYEKTHPAARDVFITPELTALIFNHLPGPAFIAASQVCRHWDAMTMNKLTIPADTSDIPLSELSQPLIYNMNESDNQLIYFRKRLWLAMAKKQFLDVHFGHFLAYKTEHRELLGHIMGRSQNGLKACIGSLSLSKCALLREIIGRASAYDYYELYTILLNGPLPYSLHTLIITHSDLDDRHTNHLFKIIGAKKTITSVDLSHNHMGPEKAPHLCEALRKNRTITSLNLATNRINDQGIDALSEGLRVNKSIRSLNLSDNQIEHQGALYLSNILQFNMTITCLNLSNNKMRHKGAHHLFNALEKNTTITTLNLGGNNIKYTKEMCLSQFLEKNRTVTSLNLSNNNINFDGVWHICRGLEKNTTITTLNLGGNISHSQFLSISFSFQGQNKISENVF